MAIKHTFNPNSHYCDHISKQIIVKAYYTETRGQPDTKRLFQASCENMQIECKNSYCQFSGKGNMDYIGKLYS